MEQVNDELLFNADFRTRLRVLQNEWADAKISVHEYMAKRKELEDEYKNEKLSTSDQTENR